eukprot:CAMPEP_0169100914 /NCGR_PEP_ID=MMETSP1015-20121227/21347_1 /TAXON_ID=342587 /ORGANISM="Karlodinium micrum, Strain CCMP2283" /LENGTH=192 /DNA_ID=CAMNT_0009161899 /DNA_START=226 /DNA_END=804 /DNA_ORIENTATION=-
MSSQLSRQGLVRNTAAALVGAGMAWNRADLAFAEMPREAYADESIMKQKAHGTTENPVQKNLLYGVDRKIADRICSYNRRWAEQAGYWEETSFPEKFLATASETQPVTFYDSVTGKPLFRAPVGRTAEEFLKESKYHGWPSFRDEEVVWENMRVLRDGEAVSVDGTHLGHNLPDRRGNRYCINLVSVSGQPA